MSLRCDSCTTSLKVACVNQCVLAETLVRAPWKLFVFCYQEKYFHDFSENQVMLRFDRVFNGTDRPADSMALNFMLRFGRVFNGTDRSDVSMALNFVHALRRIEMLASK